MAFYSFMQSLCIFDAVVDTATWVVRTTPAAVSEKPPSSSLIRTWKHLSTWSYSQAARRSHDTPTRWSKCSSWRRPRTCDLSASPIHSCTCLLTLHVQCSQC